jgi:hypothetical protein
MRDTQFVTFDKANEILGAKLTLSVEQWQYVHESLLALQVNGYKFVETCDDLAFEFLQLDSTTQGLPFICGKFFGSIQKPFIIRIFERQKKSDLRKMFERGKQAQQKVEDK